MIEQPEIQNKQKFPWRYIIVGGLVSAAIGITTGHLLAVRTVHERHDDFLTRLNQSQELQVFKGVERFQTNKEIQQAFEKLNLDDNFDYESSLAVINKYEKLNNRLHDQNEALCNNDSGRLIRSKDFPQPNKLRLLDEKTRQDVELIKKTFQELESDGMCASAKTARAYEEWTIAANRVQVYVLRLQETNAKDNDAKSKLLDFAQEKYTPKDMDAIKRVYGDKYVSRIKESTHWFRLVYDFLTAPTQQHQDALKAERNNFDQINKDAANSYKEMQKQRSKIDSKRYQTLYEASARLNTSPDKTLYSPGIWTDSILAEALTAYSLDHDGVYPKAASIDDLIKTLISGKYVTDKIPFQTLAYKSVTGYGFHLTVTVKSGKKYTYEHYVTPRPGQPKEPEYVPPPTTDIKLDSKDIVRIDNKARPFEAKFIEQVSGRPFVMKISQGDYESEPNSQLVVYIDSPVVRLGVLKSEKWGSFTGEIALPSNSKSGVQTVHLVGKTYSGEPIDFYQTIEILPDGSFSTD